MSSLRETPPTADHSETGMLPGAAVIRSIRRLVIWALVGAALYSVFMHATRAGCFGGLGTDGEWLGRDGQPTDVEPLCYSLQLNPSPFVLLALAVTLVWAISRVMRRARSEEDAHRILGRAAMVVVAIALGSFAIGQTWFFLLPLEEWAGTGTLILPFPFASVDVDVTPLTQR